MTFRMHAMPARQRGFTVVELLIAGVLGLVLLAGLGQLFLGSSATFRMQRQLADIQDSGRFAVWFLKSDIERAGWFEAAAPADPTLAIVAGVEGGDDANDTITISYEAPATGTDCTGAEVGVLVQNQYSVNDNRELVCTGNGGATQPLVANVDSFQVLYGIDVNNPPEVNAADVCSDRAVDQFVRADEIGDGVVVAVRFALLVGGESNTSVPLADREYPVADQELNFNDQIIRRVFSLTVPVQNVPAAGRCPEE